MAVINDESIIVNMIAEKGPFSSLNGAMFAIGQFGGNTITTDEKGNSTSVNVKQVINPSHMSELGDNFNTLGRDMMHELSEAYIGGQNALKYGIKGTATNKSANCSYDLAHNEASKKYPNSSFHVYARDKNGNTTKDANVAVGFVWFYIDSKTTKPKVLQIAGIYN